MFSIFLHTLSELLKAPSLSCYFMSFSEGFYILLSIDLAADILWNLTEIFQQIQDPSLVHDRLHLLSAENGVCRLTYQSGCETAT